MRLAVVGDVHTYFDAADVAWLNGSDVDVVLFVGDLCNMWPWEGLPAARQMARLTKPAIFVPGNHDTAHLFHILADVKRVGWLERLAAVGQGWRAQRLRRALGAVVFGGYSVHPLRAGGMALDVVVARPYASGKYLTYPTVLRRQFGVGSLAESAQRLCALVDAAQAETLLFLAHNGPAGLGSGAADIWGADFLPEAGDYGDGDLATAVDYARQQGKRVVAVVAGHMHHTLKGGGQRRWRAVQDGIHYINAARVPRIADGRHHFVLLKVGADAADFSVTAVAVRLDD